MENTGLDTATGVCKNNKNNRKEGKVEEEEDKSQCFQISITKLSRVYLINSYCCFLFDLELSAYPSSV